MSEVERVRAEIRDAEAELEAARKPTDVKAALRKLQRAKAELKALERPATRRGSVTITAEASD